MKNKTSTPIHPNWLLNWWPGGCGVRLSSSSPTWLLFVIAGIMAFLFLPMHKKIARKLRPSFAGPYYPRHLAYYCSFSQSHSSSWWLSLKDSVLANDLASLSSDPGSPLYNSTSPVVDAINAALAPFTNGQPVVSVADAQSL